MLARRVLCAVAAAAVAATAIVIHPPGGLATAEPNRSLQGYVLFAIERLGGKSLTVHAGDVGVDAGGLFLSEGLHAPTSRVAGDLVDARSAACAELFANVAFGSPACGPAQPYVGPLVADVPAACGFPVRFPACDDAETITVPAHGSLTLPSGTHGHVIVKGKGPRSAGTLTFAGGDHILCSLLTSHGARIRFAGPSRVQVVGDVVVARRSSFGPAETANGPALAPSAIRLLVNGGLVKVSKRATVRAGLCAPAADLRVDTEAILEGAFVARTIRLGRNVHATLGDTSPPVTTTSTTSTSSTSRTSTSSTSTSSSTTTVSTTTSITTSSATSTTTTSSSSTTTSVTSTTTSSTSTIPTSSSTTSTSSSSTSITSTSSSSTSTTTASSTTSTTISPLCGNNVLNPGETCDDGNQSNNDLCPADCVVDSCTPVPATQRTYAVSFAPPTGVAVAGFQVLLDYPEGRITIPGSGVGATSAVTPSVPPGTFVNVNDLDHLLRVTIAAAAAIPPSKVFDVRFQDCAGAPVPAPGDLGCTVVNASDPFTNPVSGVTCSVALP